MSVDNPHAPLCAGEPPVHPLDRPVVSEFRVDGGTVGGFLAGSDRLCTAILTRASGYADYPARTTRTLPVIAFGLISEAGES